MTRVAVIRFPGSNCDVDTVRAARLAGCEANLVWHRDTTLDRVDVVIIPGGFAYGDYLRAGAIARFSPIMVAVRRHAESGAPLLGICNGFQVLCEAGLLPGALLRNAGQRFVSRPVSVSVESTDTPFTTAYRKGDKFMVPVAHGEGRYAASPDVLRQIEDDGRVVWRYVDNPNGSAHEIAALANATGNVVGMMPHPERAVDAAAGPSAGLAVFESMASGAGMITGGIR